MIVAQDLFLIGEFVWGKLRLGPISPGSLVHKTVTLRSLDEQGGPL